MLPTLHGDEVAGIELAIGIERLPMGIESLQAIGYVGKLYDLMVSMQDA